MRSDEESGSRANVPVSVLLTDDHPVWRATVRSLLDGTEFLVVGEAATGQQALEAADRLSPELVLLDVRLGADSGLEVLAALKGTHPGMAVVLLTASDYPTFRSRALTDGADGYLVKGVDREQMLTTLRGAVQ